MLSFIVIVFLSTLIVSLADKTDGPTKSMIGDWKGSARIIVTWCRQNNLPLQLRIRENGTVTGSVGDATLKMGKLKRNRGWLGRKLKVKTDYIITGTLEGSIIAAEGIRRSRVKMPVNFDGKEFTGGFGTNGRKFGGKKSGELRAASLILKKRTSEERR